MFPVSGSLASVAVVVGFVHTIAGPDHYLPFVAMSRAGRWPLAKTLWITLACGIAHVLSSVVLGLVGISFGLGLDLLTAIEGARGEVAGWLLVASGLMYFAWGVRRAIRNRPHTHFHVHADGTIHRHEHVHQNEHLHAHHGAHEAGPTAQQNSTPLPACTRREPSLWRRRLACVYTAETAVPQDETLPIKHPLRRTTDVNASLTPWILFAVFLFGPCEALIPMFMFPAAQGNLWGVVWVTGLFGITTLLTMTMVVAAMCLGMASVRLSSFGRYGHAVAGFVVLGCGVAIKLGL